MVTHSFPNPIPTPQRVSGQTHNPLLSPPQLPQKETRAHYFENIDWIKILVPSPRTAIFTKMLPSKGGTWQMNEWFSKENLDCLPFVENPKENNEIHPSVLLLKNPLCQPWIWQVGMSTVEQP